MDEWKGRNVTVVTALLLNKRAYGTTYDGKVLRYLLARAEKIGFDLQLEKICMVIEKPHILTSSGLMG